MSPEGATSRSIDPAAETQGLGAVRIAKSYRERPVVRDVSLFVQRGEVVGLLGPNGAGKTTCFYMMTGLIRVDQGQILLDGQDVTTLPMYQRARLGVGYLPQEPSIFRGLTVEQNVMAIVELTERSRSKRKDIVDGLLAELRVDHLKDAPATALSGGERRRVEIARALATHPSYHPAGRTLRRHRSASRSAKSATWSGIFKDRGIGVLITDHNVRDDARQIIDRAYDPA